MKDPPVQQESASTETHELNESPPQVTKKSSVNSQDSTRSHPRNSSLGLLSAESVAASMRDLSLDDAVLEDLPPPALTSPASSEGLPPVDSPASGDLEYDVNQASSMGSDNPPPRMSDAGLKPVSLRKSTVDIPPLKATAAFRSEITLQLEDEEEQDRLELASVESDPYLNVPPWARNSKNMASMVSVDSDATPIMSNMQRSPQQPMFSIKEAVPPTVEEAYDEEAPNNSLAALKPYVVPSAAAAAAAAAAATGTSGKDVTLTNSITMEKAPVNAMGAEDAAAMMLEVPIGEAPPENTAARPSGGSSEASKTTTPWYKTRKAVIGALLLILVVASVVAGVVIGTSSSSNSPSNPSSGMGPSPTESPGESTSAPTEPTTSAPAEPTITVPPRSPSPTLEPTLPPMTTPEPTEPQTDAPTPVAGGIPTVTQQPALMLPEPTPAPQVDPTPEPTEEAGPKWEQDGNDFVGDDPGDEFGSAVAVSDSGRTVVVGAPGRNYVRMHINPLSPQTITRPDLDGFGHSIAFSSSGDISGGDIVAMASKDGTVLTYQRIATEFLQLGQELDGTSVSLSADGRRLAVTRQGRNNLIVDVRQFNEDDQEWRPMGVQQIRLDSPFGASSITTISLAPDGLAVAVGVSGPDDSGTGRGFVQVYEMQAGDQSWIPIGNVIDGPLGDTPYMGYSLSLLGSPAQRYLAVGAKYNDPMIGRTGRVRIFERTTSDWRLAGNVIEAGTTAPLDGPDYSVSLRQNRLAIGEPFFESGMGRVRVFQFDGDNEWSPVGGELTGTTPNAMFGSSVSFGEEHLAVGAPGAGRAQVYTLSATPSSRANR